MKPNLIPAGIGEQVSRCRIRVPTLRRVNTEVFRCLNIGYASILDQTHCLKLELSRKLPSLHDHPPVPLKHSTRCLRTGCRPWILPQRYVMLAPPFSNYESEMATRDGTVGVMIRFDLNLDKALLETMKPWFEAELGRIPPAGGLAEAIRYALTRWAALCRFLDDGRIELDNNPVERAIRPIAMGESLYTPSSSVCKHWKRVGISNATRAPFSHHRIFDHFRRQVVGTDLIRRAGNNLHSRKDTGFDKASYRVVCDA